MTTIDLDELRGTIRGDVLTATDEQWSDVLLGHNPAVAHEPAVIVDAATTDDIRAAVGFAAANGLKVAVQATGHGPSQRLSDGLLIRTGRLGGIEVDAEAQTVRVQPGVVWGDLMSATAEHGLTPLGMASVASVGVVGYTVGGGVGPLGRAQGMGADHVRAVELVTADGTVRTVDDNDPELFWAIKGGRSGFGVITSMTLDLIETPAVAGSSLTFARADVPTALAAWATWQAELTEDTSTVASLMRFPDVEQLPEQLRGKRFLQVETVHLGDEAALTAAVDRLVEQVAPEVRNDMTGGPSDWLHAQPPIPVAPTWNRGAVIDRLDGDAVDRILAATGPEIDAPWQVAELRPLGGALARPPAADNAVGIRPDGVLVNTVSGNPPTFGDMPAAHGELLAALGDHVRPGVPVNFQGVAAADNPLSAGWTEENLQHLEAIRRSVDPDGIFDL